MSKTKNAVSVKDLPFIDSLSELNLAERKKYGLYLPSGQTNYYRIQQMKGQGGSTKDETWDKATHHHTCCQSKVPWRHKTSCSQLNFND